MNAAAELSALRDRRQSLQRLFADANERGIVDLIRFYALSINRLTNQIIIEQYNARNGPRR